jgi:hypothetical protein
MNNLPEYIINPGIEYVRIVNKKQNKSKLN